MTAIRVGTTNRGKLRELREMLEPLGYEVHGIDDLEDLNVVEDAPTFAQNAVKKARAVVAATGEAAVADDSGLEVDALDGAPGVHSARYAGVDDDGQDEANRKKLLAALEGIPTAERTARFVCALAYVRPDGLTRVFCGEVEGLIGTTERGSNGFGYDPLFIVPEKDGRTTAELPPEEKNAISHRGRALRQLVAYLRSGEE